MSNDANIYFRTVKQPNPYAQVRKSLINDTTISPNCRWMIIYLLNLPDNVDVMFNELYEHAKDFLGRDKIYKIIDEAMKAGYMRREDVFKNNLKRGCIYYVSEIPQFKEHNQKLKKSFRCPDFRYPEIQEASSLNTNSLNTNNIFKKEEEEEERESLREKEKKPKKGAKPPDPPPIPLVSFGSHVKIKKEDYDSFCQEHGKELVDDVIDTMNNKIASGEKTPFKSYCPAIRNWIKLRKKWEAQEAKKAERPGISPQQGNNRQWAQQVKERFKDNNSLFVGDQGITFYAGATQILIKYEEHGFRDKILSILRKMRLSVMGLE